MEYVVCPEDATHLKAVAANQRVVDSPVMRCPQCTKPFVLTADGDLDPLTEPESE